MYEWMILIICILLLVSGCGFFSELEGEAKISFEHDLYMGIGENALITVEDTWANLDSSVIDRVTVNVSSQETDMLGEEIELLETGKNSGVFNGTLGFERTFDNEGYAPLVTGDGRVGVYADGGADVRECISAQYLPREDNSIIIGTTFYEEPPSTVSGIVKDLSGEIVTGASVNLYNKLRSVDITVGSRSDGVFAIYDIPSGSYTLEADKDNFICIIRTVFVP
ncbi:MAG: carboxypeptidase regulatory-like domain-containing protein [Spirochaetales bacterium]|nr:carboxypeptidase regulatory-like domain-containing protein [Spirochaetales bacterium]